MPSSWLDNVVPCSSVYVYQSALICSDCARLLFRYRPHRTGEDTTDSDHYPQGPHPDGGGEADSPQHCDKGPDCVCYTQIPGGAKIGCPLGNLLTRDGEKYVLESVARGILAKEDHKRAMGRLWQHLYNHVRPSELIRFDNPNTPSNLGTLLDQISPKHARVPREIYTDLDHLYGSAMTDDEVTLWRADITPEGNFANLETVLLPAAEFPGRTIEDAIAEAIDEGAWD
jgi:hypothetical protein